MKISRKKILISSLIIIYSVLVITLFCLYEFGVIYTQDVDVTNLNIQVSIKLVKDNDKPLYGRGFFITKNKVACLPIYDFNEFDITVVDLYKNEYNIVDIQYYENLAIFTTDRDNVNNINYLYGFAKKNDIIKAHIKDTPYMKNLSDSKVVDNRYKQDGIQYILCEQKLEGKAGGAVIDEHGRILGMAINDLSGNNLFFVYPQYEIMKKIIIEDIKDFFGI